MKLVMNRADIQGVPAEAILEHNGQTLEWNIGLFEKMSYTGEFDIFEQINGYWSRLPMASQDKVFDIYKRIKVVTDTIWEQVALTKALHSLVKELYEYHSLADIKHWIDYYSNLKLPDGLEETFDSVKETQKSRERTYLKEDYCWLRALSIALRPMIPVWGVFIKKTGQESGTRFKEYYAYRLLAQTNLASSAPMEFLRRYVELSIPEEKATDSATLGGLSSDDFPTWVLGLVLIRRLSIGDVRGTNPMSSLVTFMFRYIGAKVKGHDTTFIGQVKDKFFEGQNQEGENNLSKLEGYKMKQDIPDGDIAIISHYMDNMENVAREICPDINIKLINASYASIQALATKQILDPQIIITQLVLKKAISPHGLLHLTKPILLKAMAVTQALLWHKGHFELAALVSATEQTDTDELQDSGTPGRSHIPKELLEKLDALFPFSRRPFGKQKIDKRPNAAVEAINSIAVQFSAYNWFLTLPPDWVEVVTGNKNDRNYLVPYNIKIKLANLSIELANRSF